MTDRRRLVTLAVTMGVLLVTICSAAGPDFPRVITYIPWGQPADEIARFSAVMGGWAPPGGVDAVRAAGADILIFDAVSGCEMGFDPSPGANNQYVASLPAAWFLTQVGSALSEPVDESTTAFPVEATVISGDRGPLVLFVPGDQLIIDGESVVVTAVDHETRRLTVERGYVRPASAHAAGTRLAPLIMAWPNSWVMNLATTCPEAVMDETVGEETYAEHHARRITEHYNTEAFDGLFIDRAEQTVSGHLWLPNVRSIDIDQSNQLRDYGAVDEEWSAGVRGFFSHLRQQLGERDILYANRGAFNPDLVNGCHFEAFPMDDGTTYGTEPWESVMFGPTGYLAWVEGVRGNPGPTAATVPRQPFVVIQTYRDESVPRAEDGEAGIDELRDRAAVQDAAAIGFDLRKLRFGLGTALLSDGYFSFETGTFAASWHRLYWFDEYDNAGNGRGYLGQPLGDAFGVESVVVQNRSEQRRANQPDPAPIPSPTPAALGVWRRDFEGGIVLVNSDVVARRVELGGVYRRIDGTQDPDVNDGSRARRVDLPPLDAIILLRVGR